MMHAIKSLTRANAELRDQTMAHQMKLKAATARGSRTAHQLHLRLKDELHKLKMCREAATRKQREYNGILGMAEVIRPVVVTGYVCHNNEAEQSANAMHGGVCRSKLGGLAGWAVGWLVGWLVGWSVGWLGRWVCRTISCIALRVFHRPLCFTRITAVACVSFGRELPCLRVFVAHPMKNTQ